MKAWTKRLMIVALAAGAALTGVAAARAETWTLEIKRLPAGSRRMYTGPADYALRATQPQYVSMQLEANGRVVGSSSRTGDLAGAFQRIVKKEPKYESDQPFRGVVKFGSEEYAFALDAPGSKEKDAEAAEAVKKPKADSPLAKLTEKLLKSEASAPKAVAYKRLYFDFNHNGDLTDDKVIEATSSESRLLNTGSDASDSDNRMTYTQFEFPQVDLTIDAGGTKIDYSFSVSGYGQVSRSWGNVGVQFSAATYREGDITLEGKKHHVILLDYNSNGRFDDDTKAVDERRGMDGRIYPEYGDVILIDPDLTGSGRESPYEWTSGDSRLPVSKLTNIDGRYYEMTISPAGDKLTLTPSSVAVGNVTNPNGSFRALVYGDKGLIKISGKKDAPVPLPEGEWKLLSYTLDATEAEKPAPPAETKAKPKEQTSLLQALSDSLEELIVGRAAERRSGPRTSIVTASATTKHKSVKVRAGETVVMPFGPPYTPTVTGDFFQQGKQGKELSLAMSLIGSTGEVVTNLTVDGNQPAKPAFTITDPDGTEVASGNFEYG